MKDCNLNVSTRICRVPRILVLVVTTMLLGPYQTHTVHSFAPMATDVARSRTVALEATTNSNCSRNADNGIDNRRSFVSSILSSAAVATLSVVIAPQPSLAAKRYVLDDETGEYIEQEDDGNWQAEWKSRYEQMSTMSKDEIFVSARGAGNTNLKDLENESPASKKRRAFSGCRDKPTRAKLGNIDEKSCTKRVLDGDIDFVLGAL